MKVSEVENECFVCFELLNEDSGKVILKCGHLYCPSCFARHMRRDNTCGICRSVVTEEDPKEVNANTRREIEREIREEEEGYEEVRGVPIWNTTPESVYLGLMSTFMSPPTEPSNVLFNSLLSVPPMLSPVTIMEMVRDFTPPVREEDNVD